MNVTKNDGDVSGENELPPTQFWRHCSRRKCWEIAKLRVPILEWLPAYKWRQYFIPDFFAGLTLAFINVPQALAFAILANSPLISGFYSAVFSAFVYTLFGTASVSSFGPVAVGSMLTGESVAVYMTSKNMSSSPDGTEEDTALRVTYVATLTFVIGLIYLTLFTLKMGAIRVLFTKSFVTGYISGCSVHILSRSLKMIVGLKLKTHYGYFVVYKNIEDLIMNLPNSHYPTAILSAIVITIFLLNTFVLKNLVAKVTQFVVPVEAIVLVAALLGSYFLQLEKHGFSVVGKIPNGVPNVSPFNPALFSYVLPSALTISTINMATTLSMVMGFNSKLRADQEIFAMGCTNVVCSNLQCITIGNSMMRTIVAMNLGIKTLMATIVSSSILLFVMLFAGPLFEPLPSAVLGCIIVVSIGQLLIKNLMAPPSLFKQSFEEGVTWVIVFVTTVVMDMQVGLVVGFVLTMRQLLLRVIGEEENAKKKKEKTELENVSALPESEKLLRPETKPDNTQNID